MDKMLQLIFATNNENKTREINSILNNKFEVISLKQAGIDIEIDEPFDSLEENAVEKARVIYELTNKACFAEDTGLEVDALNKAPGVKSARYAGEQRSAEDNIKKLLKELDNKTDRGACFKTVIALNLNGKNHLFTGICKGTIIASPRGTMGFGYDPVFIPEGGLKTFAEMEISEKNVFSHRRKATELLVDFLSKLKNS